MMPQMPVIMQDLAYSPNPLRRGDGKPRNFKAGFFVPDQKSGVKNNKPPAIIKSAGLPNVTFENGYNSSPAFFLSGKALS